MRRSSESPRGAGDEASQGEQRWRALLRRVPPTLEPRSRCGHREPQTPVTRGSSSPLEAPPRETYCALTGGLPAAATPDGTGRVPVAYLAAAGALPHGERRRGAPQPGLPLPPPSRPPPEVSDARGGGGERTGSRDI